MAPLVPSLSLVTVGKETTFGTAVTATVKWMDVLEAPTFDPGASFVRIPSIRGSLAKSGYIVARAKEMPPAFSWKHLATYEDISYHLETLFGTISPTGTNPYVRAGQAPLTSVPTSRMQTIHLANLDGTDGFFYKHVSTIGKKIAFSVKSNDYATLTVDRISQKVIASDATAAATGSLNDRTVSAIMGNDMLLYIDAVGGTIGTTAITPAGYEASWEVESNRVQDMQLGGTTPVQHIEGQEWTGKLSLKLIWSSSSKAYVDALFGTTTAFTKQVRLKFTTGSSAIAQFDFAGTVLNGAQINEGANETVVATLNFENTYNSALGNWFKFSTTNAVATLA